MRRLGVVLLLGAVTVGCVNQKDPTVRVNALQSDIVFGLKPATTSAPAPGQAPIAVPTQVSGSPGVTVPQLPVGLPIFVLPTLPKECPAAALDAFPDQTAPLIVTTMPTAGTYKWELGGIQTVAGSPVDVSGTSKRLIRRITPIPKIPSDNFDSIDFTFEQLEPYDANGTVLQITYQVRTNNRGQRFEQPQTGVNTSIFVTTPDAGMSILAEDLVTPAGNVTPLFRPVVPLLVMPLPVQPGGQFLSVTTDPASGAVTTLQASEVRRARVDACGTIIEGWEVAGLERTVSSSLATAGGATAVTNLAFTDNVYATQLGAMMIAEHSVQQLGGNRFSSVDDVIGQQKPGPLPQGAA